MAKIALVSDVHLGTRQYGLKERYEDFLSSFEKFGKRVSAMNDVDAVVIGGDLFDSPRPDARSVLVAQEVVSRISGAGKVIFGIDGNHDLSGGDWMGVIGATPLPDMMPISFKGVKIVGVNYRSGRDFVSALQQMVDMGVHADVLVAHFALAEMNGGGSADTGVQEMYPFLKKMDIKCVLMGHVHIPDCREWNGALFVNPGSTEMRSVNEPKDKVFYVVDTETWEAEHVPLETRKVEEVEISSEEDLVNFQMELENDARTRANIENCTQGVFYQIIMDDSIDDAFRRLSKTIHDTSTIARIVMRSNRARDLAPTVDARKESLNTLESAIEARFPRDSDEARLILSMLRSPDPSSIHMIVKKFMEGEST